MNSKIATMGLFAALMVAAFAGIVANDVDADATEEAQVIQYTVGTTVYSEPVPAGATTVTLKDLDTLGYAMADGKTFRGWSTDSPATSASTIYSAGSTYAVATGLTLYAVIEDVTYKVTFAYADGTAILTKDAQAYDTDLTLPAKATSVASGKVLVFREIDGQIFAGWALKAAPADVVIAPSETKIKVTGNADYVAVYVHDPVLTFVVDGTTTYKHTEYGAVLPTAPSKEGFTFVGWNDGEQTIIAADLTAYVAGLKKDVVLSAVWKPAVYTVHFYADGEEILPAQSVKHGELVTEPKTIPVKEGCDFVRWNFEFATPVTSDLEIQAVFEPTPAPAPTGFDDPTTQVLAICLGTMVLAMIALAIWKREAIRVAMLKRLDKGKNKGPGDGQA